MLQITIRNGTIASVLAPVALALRTLSVKQPGVFLFLVHPPLLLAPVKHSYLQICVIVLVHQA